MDSAFLGVEAGIKAENPTELWPKLIREYRELVSEELNRATPVDEGQFGHFAPELSVKMTPTPVESHGF